MYIVEVIVLILTSIPVYEHMVISEGRLKSPAIDFDHENSSIGGDFNRPSNAKINVQILSLSIYGIIGNCGSLA